jgi:hypothetical protein
MLAPSTSPSFIATNVGMLITPNFSAKSGSSSTFTLHTFIFPSFSSAIFENFLIYSQNNLEKENN